MLARREELLKWLWCAAGTPAALMGSRGAPTPLQELESFPRRANIIFFLIVRRTSPKWKDSLYSTNSRVLVSKDEGKVDE